MAEQMSFLPDDYLERRTQRRTNLVSLILFVIVMAAVVGAFLVTDRQAAEVRKLRAAVDQQFQDRARRIDELEQLDARKQRMVEKAHVTRKLVDPVQRSLVLSELINNMPDSVGMLEFALETREVRAAAAKVTSVLDLAKQSQKGGQDKGELKGKDVNVMMVGVAPDDVQVAQFMTALGKLGLFTDLNLAFSEQIKIEDMTVRKFRIEMRVNQEIDAQRYEPTMVKRDGDMRNPMESAIDTPSAGTTIVTPAGGRAAPSGAQPTVPVVTAGD